MRLHIAPNRLISDIQKEFNHEFLYLKLEFFNKRALSHSDFSRTQLIQGNRKVGDVQLVKSEGDLDITGEMKVLDLEKTLKEEFSLAVQVFRKSGNLWLKTTMTDNWTLNQQNNHGRELSAKPNHGYDANAEDFDLNRDADH